MGPLQGVRIIDMTSVLMGPYATQMLGDYGADVVKVEPPEGDITRLIGPVRNEGMGPLFLNGNRSKRSIVPRPESAGRPRGPAEARRHRRCAGLQCAAAGDGTSRARL